ncbi:metal-dependent transcriptional regulator [Mucilaginibacter daejeonensis]|uniref:metal-dependent transcriptional regulator n=1 Tax=Mucilaginibacter daejeonensis TaxID=398049 RepID=UPI001D1737C4|nr:metal-dependent transcriptional regulator [Mucilaginibacter daejeonensis]UEG55240.1 metal-dependent transcriptional regulator [Mucilaginibacter daejeonensis]
MHSFTEENYLKAIYHLLMRTSNATTNDIAAAIGTKAASVTDMLKKLADKKLINYARYQGVTLTEQGRQVALAIVRKHRLWEYFLVKKLNFRWDEVHDMAEELEHISSTELINRLDSFMGCPQFDPHGDPIPDADGQISVQQLQQATSMAVDQSGVITAVADHTASFLQYLEKNNLMIGNTITVTDTTDYDVSVLVKENDQKINISHEVAKHILIAI